MAVNVTVIGMDALGTSIGLALKASKSPMNVTLHDREHSIAGEALRAGAGDRVEWNLLRAVSDADLVFVNEPLHQIRETIEVIGPELKPDAVVTDTVTVKEAVLHWAEEILPANVHFVGGTPLVTADVPSPYLFQKHRYAIIPLTKTEEAAVRLVTDTVTLMGAEPFFISVAEHESLLAAVQHLPALTSAALLQLTAGSQSWKEMASMASPTYGIATALPTEDPTALVMLLRHNRESLHHWLTALQRELGAIQTLLEQDDNGEALEEYLDNLMEARARWKQAQQQNPDVPSHQDSLEQADEMRGLARWFGFGRRRSD
ncbi:MAG: prephenate dehydrogenase [Chloroflexota bacterium]|nr:prephenate dehydrogenase [Chloroflexota bacterium]